MNHKQVPSPRAGDILTLGSHHIHVLECGDRRGSDVVMLHGCGSVAEEVVMPFEGSGFRIIAPDRPGYGFSSQLPQGARGPIGQAVWLESLFESMGLSRVLLVAHSLGSAAALHLAIRRPDLVRGILLISPCCRPVPFKPFIVLRTAVAPLVGDVVRRHVIGRWPGFFLDKGLRSSSFPNPLPLHLSDLPAGHVVSPMAIQTMADELRAFNRDMQDLPDLPAEIPLSVLFGARDSVIQAPWHIEFLRRRHPSPLVELLPGVGHLPHHVAPELAVQMLRDLAERSESPQIEEPRLHVA
jgi:pimeloyl-ACP methyl ester carboxylesterase